ncbi:MAG: sigma-70 factor domain-containing protein, partial [Janibacter sp.]
MTAVSPRSEGAQGSLPQEFSHPALQELVRRGHTAGAVTSDQLQVAFSEAKISPSRGRVVLRALDDQGIEVQVPQSTAAKSAKKSTAKKAAATASEDTPAKKTATKKTATKKAAAPAAKKATTKKAATKKTATKKAATTTTAAAAASAPKEMAPAKKAAAKKAAAKKMAANPTTTTAEEPEEGEDEVLGGDAKAKDKPEPETDEKGGFVISNDDDNDAPAQQVVTAGATADPVKDYLKQIGKVALLNAEQEVELAKRIEAGLFAEEKMATLEKIDMKFKRELWWISQDGKNAKNHLLEANLRL